jgi:superfamily II DNA or RNA helicase
MLKLYKHQEEFLNQRKDKSALVWSCGTGKTRTAIEWAKQSPLPVLIVINQCRSCDKGGVQED